MSLKEADPIDLQDHVKDVFLIGLHSTTPMANNSSDSTTPNTDKENPLLPSTSTSTSTSSCQSLSYLDVLQDDKDLIKSNHSSTSSFSSRNRLWISNGMFPVTISIQFDTILCLSKVQLHGIGVGKVEMACLNKENDLVYSCEFGEEEEEEEEADEEEQEEGGNKTPLAHKFPDVFCSSLTVSILNSTSRNNLHTGNTNQFVVLKKVMCFGKGLNIFSGEKKS